MVYCTPQDETIEQHLEKLYHNNKHSNTNFAESTFWKRHSYATNQDFRT
jgi:hypothetical protein